MYLGGDERPKDQSRQPSLDRVGNTQPEQRIECPDTTKRGDKSGDDNDCSNKERVHVTPRQR